MLRLRMNSSNDNTLEGAEKEDMRKHSCPASRTDMAILAELRDRLEGAPCSSGGVEAVVENGVVTLTGVVPNVASKRHAEASARSIERVIDVQNALHTDASITVQVTNALLADARMDAALVRVWSERGVVILKGRVDSPEVCQVAGEVAAKQAGVTGVVNDLEVKIDDATELLRSRCPYLDEYCKSPIVNGHSERSGSRERL